MASAITSINSYMEHGFSIYMPVTTMLFISRLCMCVCAASMEERWIIHVEITVQTTWNSNSIFRYSIVTTQIYLLTEAECREQKKN